MEDKQIMELADQLKAAKERKSELEEQTKEVNAEIDRLDLALSDAMAEAELDKFTHSGSTFYLKSRLFASPIAGKKEDLYAVLKQNGFGSLVTESVNANTLASFVKEQKAENNDEVPEWLDGYISTFEKVSVGIRKK